MPNVLILNINTNTRSNTAAAGMAHGAYAGNVVNGNEQINRITILRRDDVRAAHWEMFLRTVGGVIIKVDLMEHFYRVIYGANIPVNANCTSDDFDLTAQRSLGTVIQDVAFIATQRGDWTGTDAYNCQDFVILFMARIGMSASEIFKYELRRRVTKFMPPAITHSKNGYIQTEW